MCLAEFAQASRFISGEPSQLGLLHVKELPLSPAAGCCVTRISFLRGLCCRDTWCTHPIPNGRITWLVEAESQARITRPPVAAELGALADVARPRNEA